MKKLNISKKKEYKAKDNTYAKASRRCWSKNQNIRCSGKRADSGFC